MPACGPDVCGAIKLQTAMRGQLQCMLASPPQGWSGHPQAEHPALPLALLCGHEVSRRQASLLHTLNDIGDGLHFSLWGPMNDAPR